MKRLLPLLLLPLLCAPSQPHKADAPVWGFFGHKRINRLALFTLPQELFGFFKPNLEYITEHAVDPDKRRYASEFEGPRHYIDLDVYGPYDPKNPYPDVPRRWSDALEKYASFQLITPAFDTLSLLPDEQLPGDSVFLRLSTARFPIARRTYTDFFRRSVLPNRYAEVWTVDCDSMRNVLGQPDLDCSELTVLTPFAQEGILPWFVPEQMRRLTRAFENRDVERILRYTADLGHYLGDAHVPLHTTKNYNGQMTGQRGIHAFWESRIPELFADEEWDYWTGPARYIPDIEEWIWDIVLESHSHVDSVLLIEADLRERIPADNQMCYVNRGGVNQFLQCEDFARAYAERMRGMVEDRFRASIRAVGSAWYTCWVDAGRPDLSPEALNPPPNTDEVVERAFEKGKIRGRAHGD